MVVAGGGGGWEDQLVESQINEITPRPLVSFRHKSLPLASRAHNKQAGLRGSGRLDNRPVKGKMNIYSTTEKKPNKTSLLLFNLF